MRNLRILCYHGIARPERPDRSSYRNVPTAEEFRIQMAYLKERCRIVSLDEVRGHCADGTSPDRFSAAVTFDDGAASVMLAAPILFEFGIPFTVFLPTRFIGSDELPWFVYLNAIMDIGSKRGISLEKCQLGHPLEFKTFRKMAKARLLAEPYLGQMEILSRWAAAAGTSLGDIRSGGREFLDWEQAKGLAARGASFASHTWSHVDLRMLSGVELEREFSLAKADITEHLGAEHARFVAYPDGRFDERVLEVARRYHEMGLAERYRYASWGDMHRLPRRGINQGGLSALKYGLSTRREVASWVKQRLRGLLGAGQPLHGAEPRASSPGLAAGTEQPEKQGADHNFV